MNTLPTPGSSIEQTPNSPEAIRAMVREKYARIAEQSRDENKASCCGAGGCSTETYTIFAEDYSTQPGYVADADLGLGCGIPTEFANIQPGQVVLDLGSGAGNDAFVARHLVGETGKVIGVDMTEAMIDKARDNAEKLGYHNVEFRQGEIEKLPLAANRVDVIVSNCVLNLVPNKATAFAEMFRVLKPGGHFCVSDIVLGGLLPDGLKHVAELYAGCVSGAIAAEDYLGLLQQAGFEQITVNKNREIQLPTDLLEAYLSPEQLAHYRSQGGVVRSITVSGYKPLSPTESAASCSPGCCN